MLVTTHVPLRENTSISDLWNTSHAFLVLPAVFKTSKTYAIQARYACMGQRGKNNSFKHFSLVLNFE